MRVLQRTKQGIVRSILFVSAISFAYGLSAGFYVAVREAVFLDEGQDPFIDSADVVSEPAYLRGLRRVGDTIYYPLVQGNDLFPAPVADVCNAYRKFWLDFGNWIRRGGQPDLRG